jgi:glycine cleavage system protein P-like pyridoxal-binding family
MTEPTDLDPNEELKRFAKRLDALEKDPVMRMVSNMAKEAKADLRDRYIAAAKEKDPFWRAAKKPIVFPEELR